MEAPVPFIICTKTGTIEDKTNNNTSQSKNITKKEYKLKCENKIYHLQIEIDPNYIYLKIIEYKEDGIIPIYYRNKFNLQTITKILKLYPEIYNDLNKVLSLLNDSYYANKVKLSKHESNINLIITIVNGNLEIDCPIDLIETKTGIDDKFEIIINDIKSLKMHIKNSDNNKIIEIEKTVKDIQFLANKKFEENENKIKELSTRLEKSEKNVKLLKNELFDIKEYIKKRLDCNKVNNEKNEITLKDNNEGKITKDNDNKNEITKDKGDDKNDINIEDTSEKIDINTMITKKNNNQQNNENELYYNYNNEQGIIINNYFDNDIKEGYKTPRNINKKFIRKLTNQPQYFRDNYNSFHINKDLNDDLTNNKNSDIEYSFQSFFSESPMKSDDSSDDRSNYGNILFKNNKWKAYHSKRKLPCISQEVDEPIPPIRKIPKFKIFRGFKGYKTSIGI